MKTYTSQTYLKDIEKYIYYQYSMNNIHISIKKFLKADPFVINEDGTNIKVLGDNYYLMEIVPMDKNYICRVHLDQDKNIVERYYILSLKNEFVNNIPVFDNLKTAYVICNFQRKIYNEENLDKLLKEEKITDEEYKKLKKVLLQLIDEINIEKNEIFNMDYKKIIDMVEEV